MKKRRIGVFDSGVGGASVANAIRSQCKDVEVTLKEDAKNVPYGTKTPELLFSLVLPVLKDLAATSDVIVIACNTVSTTLAEQIRNEITIPVIVIEPMVKPASQLTTSKTIAVCATPTTLASRRYRQLKQNYTKHLTVLEPDCSDWASMIQANQIEKKTISNLVDDVCGQQADVIVLGCTHYHWIEALITEATKGRAIVLQPEMAVITQLKRVLEQLA